MSGARSAIGSRVGDYLELRNQWACVIISREECAPYYLVTGDLADLHVASKEFTHINAAIAYAWESLALYQQGRAD